MAKLDGKVALITGAAAGLGEGISTAYAKYGAKLIMVDLSPEVEKTAEKLRKEYNAEIITVVANVADPHRWMQLLHRVLKNLVRSMLHAATQVYAVWLLLRKWMTRPVISTLM